MLILNRIFFISFFVLGFSISLFAQEDFPAPRDAVECTPRAGLPNFLAKANQGGDFKVAYLGGSITAQAGWRVKSLAFLNQQYPKSKLTEIAAAIGGTGSDLGVLRIDHDVLSRQPDLLFVEFAVNDTGTPPEEIVRSMEGIVRKTWKTFPKCDICFVYTFNQSTIKELQTGKLNRSAATMEVVADFYNIPTIHLGLEAVRLEAEGKLLLKAPEAKMERVSGDELNQSSKVPVGTDGKIPFSKDGTHPYIDTGHQLYEEAIERSFPKIVSASRNLEKHQLKSPYNPKNYENSVMLSMDQVAQSGTWTKLPNDNGLGKDFASKVESLWKAEPNAELSFSFKGSAVKIYDLLGPDSGKIQISIDGQISNILRFDGYCTYNRLSLVGVANDLDEKKVHQVSIKVLSEKIEKEKILFDRNRADLTKSPEKYEGANWYAGAIFLVGELVK
jgi:hypothetical protein